MERLIVKSYEQMYTGAFSSMKERRTELAPCECHTLKGRCASINQELEITANTLRKLEGLEIAARGECYEITEDEVGTHRATL